MRIAILIRPLAASTLLFAAACGGSSPAVEASNETVNDLLANADEAVPESVNQTGEGVDLVSLPPAPADAPAAETAPLAQAAQLAGEIDSGTGVERVPYEGGWAWRRDGRIIRTASRDGRRVSWFRPGESAPFLVQQGDETFAYAGGRPQRAFDRGGRPAAVPPQRQEEARRLADQSRHDRDQAERAPRRPDSDRAGQGPTDNRNDSNRGDAHDGNTAATARPGRDSHTPPANRDGRRPDDRRDRRDDDNGNRQ